VRRQGWVDASFGVRPPTSLDIVRGRLIRPRRHVDADAGIGRCQREGKPIEEIRPGDRIFFEPGENHWHGVAPNRFMTHTAIQEADENGSPVTWGEHVPDEQYNAAPSA
jgi:hypothetical protein